MCSIFGFNQIRNKTLRKTFFDNMRHRGPDDDGFIEVAGWTFANQRLAIIDTSARANQPLVKDNGILVFNGEIYNYEELKRQYLAGVRLKTESDTEVLLELLCRYGMGILNKLNGMFAFAWYDRRSSEIVLARDRFGVKPLLWTRTGKKIYFSSEIWPLVKVLGKVRLNNVIVKSFIEETATDYDDTTYIKDINQVPAGHYLRISPDRIPRLTQWYRFKDFPFNSRVFENYQETLDYFEDLLIDAIKLRHRSDVPICITLSGGLDSTTIYTLTKEHISSSMRSFTFSHPGKATDETERVMRLAKEYGDTPIIVKSEPRADLGTLRQALKSLEFPIWNNSATAYLQVYEAIKKHKFKVVLEGHGSDEQLGGYPHMIEKAWQDVLHRGDLKKSYDLYHIYIDTLNAAINQKGIKYSFRDYCLKFGAGILSGNIRCLLKSITGQSGDTTTFQEELDDSFDRKIIPIVLRAFDRLPMSQSVESRSPFLDYRVVEFCRKLPMEFKVNKIGSKAILREILKKYKKNYIYQVKAKMGFASDVPALFNNSRNRKEIIGYVQAFSFPGYEELQQQALENMQKEKILWSDISPIWKVLSLEMTRQMYEQR